jgi:hypothetical protein
VTDVQKLKEYLVTLPNRESLRLEYSEPARICFDAVMSIRRRYFSTVVPRIVVLQDSYPEVKSLTELILFLEEINFDGFCKIFNYNDNKEYSRYDIMLRTAIKTQFNCNFL